MASIAAHNEKVSYSDVDETLMLVLYFCEKRRKDEKVRENHLVRNWHNSSCAIVRFSRANKGIRV